MKRLLGAALALTLLGGSAAVAAPTGYDNRGYGHESNNGALFAGIGLFALAAILASQNNRSYQRDWHDRGYGRFDNSRGYNHGYDRDRDDRRSGYSHR